MTKENKERMEALIRRVSSCIKKVTGKEAEFSPASTDSNIPLSLGIPSVTLGTITGDGAHTRQEWIDLYSLKSGMELALSIVLDFF